MSNRINAVFSVSVFAILAAGVGSGYLLHNNHKVNQAIEKEPEVLSPLPQPKVEQPVTLPAKVEEHVIETPRPTHPKSKVAFKATLPRTALAQAMKPCEMVCEDQ